MWRLLAAAGVVYIFLPYFLHLNSVQFQSQPSPNRVAGQMGAMVEQRSWDPDQRVAWLVPFLSAPTMPFYADLCLHTSTASSPFILPSSSSSLENTTMMLPK